MPRIITLALSALTLAACFLLPAARAGDGPDQIPMVISQDPPEYPFSLRLSGNDGKVVIDFDVDKNGNVSRPEVKMSSHPDFEAPAVEAVLKWKFRPAVKNGHPVNVRMEVPVIFQLQYSHSGEPYGVEPWRIPESAPKSFPPQFQYDEPPKPLVTSAPVYPFDLLTQKVKGKATVTFAVDEFGRTHLVKILSASQPEFGAAAAAMIEAWSFEPAKKGGKASWALLRKEQVFSRNADDFPVNDSAERLLKDLNRSPCPILRGGNGLDAPLRGRFQPGPVVPDAVIAAKTGAEAVVEFIIDHAGHAQLPRIVSSTNADFGWAAATAVGRWQFTVPTKEGKPVDVFVRVPLVYIPPKPLSTGS
jgi:TonB family protein